MLLSNHNADIDPFLVMLGTGRHARFVASANILKGFIGTVLKTLAGPIPRSKGAGADDTVKLIEENLKNGINVAMFPEGNKSWDGETCYISPRTATLVKESGVGLVTYRLDGDYMRRPRWAKSKRKGPVYGKVVAEYSAEDVAKMDEKEIYDHICRDLYVNAYEEQRIRKDKYESDDKAEGMELSAYLCPCCKRFDSISTQGNEISCTCGMHATVNEYGFFESDELPFDNLLAWSKWEKSFLAERKEEEWEKDKPITTDENVWIRRNDEGENGSVSVYFDRIEVKTSRNTDVYRLKDISKMGMFRSTRIYFSCGESYVELRKESGISGIKYFTLWRVLTGKEIY